MLTNANAFWLPFKNKSMHMAVTSPPYFSLRKYAGEQKFIFGGNPDCAHVWGGELVHKGQTGGVNESSLKYNYGQDGHSEVPESSSNFCQLCNAWYGAYGLEPRLDMYIQHTVEWCREVWRVLRDDGTFWCNLGDSFSVGSNFLNEFNSLVKGHAMCFGNGVTVGITSKSVNVSSDNQIFPDGKLFSLFGIERIIIKQRDNDFSQILNTLNSQSYCWVSAPTLSIARNLSDIEIVLDKVDDLSIIISEHNSDAEPVFGIFPALARVHSDSSLSIKKAAEPITEFVRDGQTIGNTIAFNAPLKSLPDIYFVNKPITLTNSSKSRSGFGGNFIITKASDQEFNFSVGNFGVNFRIFGVSHLSFSNNYGSLVRYGQLYHEANQMTNEKQAKQELGVPELVKRALMKDGWICRSTIIWHKTNPMPESVTDRPTKSHEYLFLLTKSKNYYYDADAIREKHKEPWRSGEKRTFVIDGKNNSGKEYVNPGFGRGKYKQAIYNPAGRNRRTVWTIATKPYSGAHFATYPPALIEPCIKAGTSEKGVCPECGAQWERQTDTPDWYKDLDGHKMKSGTLEEGVNAGFGAKKDSVTKPVITIGWKPTCSHYDLEPVPAKVFDPFLGSGTTALVARNLGRTGVGTDLSLEYLDLARERLSLKALDEWEQGKNGETDLEGLPMFADQLELAEKHPE